MGNQQLLLIILGIIVVGIAIISGIYLFREHAVDSKRDTLIHEGINISSMAQSYYLKPREMGGGSGSFSGWTIPNNLVRTATGRFFISNNSNPMDSIVFEGIGNEVATSGDSVRITITVTRNIYRVTIIH